MSSENESSEGDLFESLSYTLTFILWMIYFYPYEGSVVRFFVYAVGSAILSMFTYWLVAIALYILSAPLAAGAEFIRELRKRF